MRLPILVFHIFAGISALLSGAVAMSFRKGSRSHRMSGNAFVISMLCMASGAVALALMKSQVTNIMGGILTFYLVGTAWATARFENGQTGIFDWVALSVALALGVAQFTFGFEAAFSETGLKYGYPAGMHLTMGSITLLAAAGDLRMLARRGVFGVQRTARHLWRMCFALFFASGSFFLGQQKVFPAFLRGSVLLLIPAFLPLLLMIFWLVRVRASNTYKRNSSAKRGSDDSWVFIPSSWSDIRFRK